MQTNPISSSRHIPKSVLHLCILFTTSLAIGFYIIYSTELISKDGVAFIRYAQNLFSNPQETLLAEYQHPGFPFIIAIFHKILSIFIDSPFDGWLFAAQVSTVFFKTLTIGVLYLWGRLLTDSRISFWGVFIFLFLPHPAQFGSDALSDWPNLFFLSTGLLCLQVGLVQKKYILFCFTGICGGIGYLIRPESFQLVIYALLIAGLLLATRKISFLHFSIICFSVILPFAIISFPYMKLKNSFFPKKALIKITTSNPVSSPPSNSNVITHQRASISSNGRLFHSLPHLLSNFGETYMWYFTPFWLIGLYHYFYQTVSWPRKILLPLFISLNLILLILLYVSYGYMSVRHSLPLFTLTFPFITLGIQIAAEKIITKYQLFNTSRIFYLIVCVGIIICLPKLLRPLKADKRIYKDVAIWLQEEVKDGDTIAVFDPRIGFYSQKDWFVIKKNNWQQADWIVTCVSNDESPKEMKIPPRIGYSLIKTIEDSEKIISISRTSDALPENQ